MTPAMWGHVGIGIEILVGLLLLNSSVKNHLKKITIEFNGKDKEPPDEQS